MPVFESDFPIKLNEHSTTDNTINPKISHIESFGLLWILWIRDYIRENPQKAALILKACIAVIAVVFTIERCTAFDASP